MRTLPDHPSLDHVRRQAKDQLAVLRRTDPAATLTDAQASLATQYGYATWAELKAAVERQAAASATTDDRNGPRLAAAFGLGRPTAPMTLLERGFTGTTWALQTDAGSWIATHIADFIPAESVEAQSGLVEAAIAAGVLTPEPVRSTAGSFVADLDGEPWRIHRAMPLGPPLPQPPAPEVAREGGRILARIHGLNLPAPGPVVPWLTQRWDGEHWQALADQARAQEKVWAEDFAGAIPGFLELAAVHDHRNPNPRAIFTKAWHAPAGVRLAGEGRLVAVVWEHAGACPKDWDLGSALMAWSETVTNDYDPSAARAFLDGYREQAGEADAAIELRMFACGVTAALNWTISRANVALNDSDEAERAQAERNIRVLARNPITLARVEALVASLTTA